MWLTAAFLKLGFNSRKSTQRRTGQVLSFRAVLGQLTASLLRWLSQELFGMVTKCGFLNDFVPSLSETYFHGASKVFSFLVIRGYGANSRAFQRKAYGLVSIITAERCGCQALSSPLETWAGPSRHLYLLAGVTVAWFVSKTTQS